jgi:TonB-dependent receptor
MSLGLVAGAQYSRGTDATRDRLSAAAAGASEAEVTPDYRFMGESGETTESFGGIANFTLRPAANHEISLNTLFNQIDERSAVFQAGPQPSDDDNRIFRQRRVEPIERTIWSVQGKGEHLLGGSGNPRLTWSSSYSSTTQDESDVRFFTDDIAEDGSDPQISVAEYVTPTRYFRDLSEFSWSNDLELSVPFGLGNVKVGGSYLYRERDLDERRFEYDADRGGVNYEGAPGIYFSECVGVIDEGECDEGPYEGDNTGRYGAFILESTRGQNNIVGDRTVGAGFAMVDTQVPGIPKLRFIGGVRVEYTDQVIETRPPDDRDLPERGQIQETDYLPSANLVYELRNDMNVRAAYGRTLARPTFREFSPATYYDARRQELVDGNPDLERTTVDNLDLRWEWFPGRGELVAASGYFKSFDAPIERVISERTFNREVDFENQQSAQVYGAEFEVRKRLGFLADPLRYLEVGSNFTLTESTVTDTTGQDLDRPLEGQSSFLINADVSYDNPESGTTISVFYNFFDDRLDTIERQNQPDQFERGRHTIDVIASQSLMYGIEFKASVKNLLNEEVEIYQPFEAGDFTTLRYKDGRTISLGITYNL